jgi:hypothetical protein
VDVLIVRVEQLRVAAMVTVPEPLFESNVTVSDVVGAATVADPPDDVAK